LWRKALRGDTHADSILGTSSKLTHVNGTEAHERDAARRSSSACVPPRAICDHISQPGATRSRGIIAAGNRARGESLLRDYDDATSSGPQCRSGAN
ncbi:hypothetical protein HaLaN_27073, partial [Haematococcus lacustris]